LKITFLGTGTSNGVPVISCDCEVCLSEDKKDNRLRSSVLIELKELVIVIDTGPDFRQQMLREKVHQLDYILLTHEHKDHIAGLDDVRAFNFKMGKAIDLYAEDRVQKAVRNEFAYIFADHKYPGIPEINLHLVENKPFNISDIEIIPIRAMHYKLPVLGYRIGDFAYITDTNFIPEEEIVKLNNLKILVINALRKKKHLSHYSLDEALNIIQLVSPRQSYLTHISHAIGKHKPIQMELPENVYLAYDGLKLCL
jgi:phosphoribosyl 1,2-cyclic phosphate phosphodiesterase